MWLGGTNDLCWVINLNYDLRFEQRSTFQHILGRKYVQKKTIGINLPDSKFINLSMIIVSAMDSTDHFVCFYWHNVPHRDIAEY